MKALLVIPVVVAVAWIYAIKKEDQLHKYEQLDQGEDMK